MNHTKKTINFQTFSLFFSIIFLCFFVCSCSNKPESETFSITLNEVAHSIFYAPMYVSIENGYFSEEGIELTLVTGFGADKTMTAVLSDEANIGFMGSEASIYAYQEGANDYVVNFAQLTQRAGNFLVGRTPNDNFEWSDLKNSYVLGGRAGGMPEMVFEYILKKNGLDPKTDLNIDQSIDFGSTAAAFSGARKQDDDYPMYTVEFEPHATLLEQQNEGYIVASLGEASGYVPYTAFCAKKSYIESHSRELQAFTNALQKGLHFVATHDAETIAKVIAPQFNEIDLGTITTIIKRYQAQRTWKNDLIFEENSFLLLENILEESGQLKERVPYENLVTTTYAKTSADMLY